MVTHKNIAGGRKAPAKSDAKPSGVGYGRPPDHTRFQQGTSGNPNGRPKKSRNAKTIIRRVLDSTVTVREGDRKRTVSKLEGIILRQVEAALKGDAKAALAALRMMAQVGLLDPKEITEDGPQLSATERAIVDEMFEKHATRRKQK
jgi:Family of unknown function (DUF5681)